MLDWLLDGMVFETLGAWVFIIVFWIVAGIVWLISKLFGGH